MKMKTQKMVEKLTPDFLVQIRDYLGLGVLDFLKGVVAFLLQITQIFLGLKLPLKLVLYLLYLARMQLLKFLSGVVQLGLTGVNNVLELGGMLQLKLD
jgi:hypothetical protein